MLLDRGHPSEPEKWLLAVADVIRALKLDGLATEQVEARNNWYAGDSPYLGISVIDAGEKGATGVIGFEDVGYRAAIVMAVRKGNQGSLGSDPILLWRSTIRRRLNGRRIAVPGLSEDVKRHVCRCIHTAPPRKPKGGKFDQIELDQLVAIGWVREPYDNGE